MSSVQKVSIALSPEMLNEVKQAVNSGEYASTSEVIREALRAWRLQQSLKDAELERLRKAWREGIDSGPSTVFDIEAIKAEARSNFTASMKENMDD